MKKSKKLYVLALVSKVGWVVCFIVGKTKLSDEALQIYLRRYRITEHYYFTINERRCYG